MYGVEHERSLTSVCKCQSEEGRYMVDEKHGRNVDVELEKNNW